MRLPERDVVVATGRSSQGFCVPGTSEVLSVTRLGLVLEMSVRPKRGKPAKAHVRLVVTDAGEVANYGMWLTALGVRSAQPQALG
jgi:hypothetical protein